MYKHTRKRDEWKKINKLLQGMKGKKSTQQATYCCS